MQYDGLRFSAAKHGDHNELDDFVQGKGQYTSDINVEGQLHACFVRSTHASAFIKEINRRIHTGIPVLAFPQVRYVGEAIALVIATDEKTAQLAAEQIEISLDVQTGAISLKIALALCFSAIRKSYAV